MDPNMRREEMENFYNWESRSTYAMIGGVLLGLGAGFFFLPGSPFAFVGCLLGGIGVGLLVGAVAR